MGKDKCKLIVAYDSKSCERFFECFTIDYSCGPHQPVLRRTVMYFICWAFLCNYSTSFLNLFPKKYITWIHNDIYCSKTVFMSPIHLSLCY